MNIDIVNKQIAQQLQVKEADVRLINAFYWGQVKQHLYNYDPQPLTIDGVCVFHPCKKKLKKAILKYIQRIRRIRNSKKFKAGSVTSQVYIQRYKDYISKLYKIRKHHKYTN